MNDIKQKIIFLLKRPIIQFLDWYLLKYYSGDYIHRDMIKDEIKKRIKNTEERTNKKRDEELARELDLKEKNHQIKVDGFLAEIECYKEEQKEVRALQKKLINLYSTLERRAEAFSVIIAKNKHEGSKIMNVAGEFMGQLDKIEINMTELVEEFGDNIREEQKLLVK